MRPAQDAIGRFGQSFMTIGEPLCSFVHSLL